jgi:alpha-glucosidase
MRSLVDAHSEKMLVGEINLDKHEDGTVAASFYGKANDELHLAFNFEFLECPWKAAAFQAAVERWERTLPEGGWPNYVLSNHDYPRHYSRYAKGDQTEARARLAALMLFTLRGTPFLYYGEEIGMRNVRVPRWRFQDPVGKRYWPFHPGRDEERTPMQWTGGEHADFSIHDPWLPLPKDYTRRNVAIQEQNPDSLLSFYKKLSWLRKRTPALQTGRYVSLQNLPDEIFGYIRDGEGERYLILLNFADTARLVELKELADQGSVVISTSDRQDGPVALTVIQLAGNEGLLLNL